MHTSQFILDNLRSFSLSLQSASFTECTPLWKGENLLMPFASIGWIANGEGQMQVSDTVFHPQKGDLYFLPANIPQSFSTNAQNPYQKYFCHFYLDFFQSDLFKHLHFPLCVKEKEKGKAKQIFEQMIVAYQSNTFLSSFYQKEGLLQLVIYFFECVGEENILLSPFKEDSPLDQSVQYALSHLDQKVSVSKMAQIAGYNPNYFSKVFTQHFSQTPCAFLNQKRLEKALDLLLQTNDTLAFIAEQCGFLNQFYFSNFFKKHMGFSPSDYRALYQSKRL